MRAHPWHPALVHFPVACWSIAVLIDLAALLGALPRAAALAVPGVEPAALSFALLWLGVGLGVPAMIAGFADFLRLPPRLQRGAALNWHVVAMTSAWGLFLGAALLRPTGAPVPPAPFVAVVAELAAFACLSAGGVLAAAVVFDGWPWSSADRQTQISDGMK